MPERDCERLRAVLTGGETPTGEAAAHLERCAGCRGEAARLERLLDALGGGATLEPPAMLDRAVREALGRHEAPRRLLIRPFTAIGLAAAAFIALVVALGGTLAEAGAAEYGPAIAALAATAYLAISAAATIPLLLLRTRPSPVFREVS